MQDEFIHLTKCNLHATGVHGQASETSWNSPICNLCVCVCVGIFSRIYSFYCFSKGSITQKQNQQHHCTEIYTDKKKTHILMSASQSDLDFIKFSSQRNLVEISKYFSISQSRLQFFCSCSDSLNRVIKSFQLCFALV